MVVGSFLDDDEEIVSMGVLGVECSSNCLGVIVVDLIVE